MRFSASAPCKAILFGEHYVVYGSPALSIAIEPRNTVEFSDAQGGRMELHSVYGDGRLSQSGAWSGPDGQKLYVAVAKAVFGQAPVPACSVKFVSAWKLKGVGTSASLCAAFAAGLFRLAGKTPTAEGIFAAAQAGDLVAHGGRASGIDAKTVSFGKPLVFERKFAPPRFDSEDSPFRLPSGCSLLLIDTFNGKKDGTGKMLEIFAGQFGIAGAPPDASEAQRQGIREEFAPLWQKIGEALRSADAKALGGLMSENHALLRKRKMSSAGIEKAVSCALAAGAYGAKLTGGGGEGGAVLALCGKKKAKGIGAAIADAGGFSCHQIGLAKKGACVD